VPEDKRPRPFDVQTIRHLVRLMSRHDLSEIDLQEGDQRIRLRRGGPPAGSAALPVATPVPVAQPTQPATPGPVPAAEHAARKLVDIKSPAVGTFYAQKEEGAAPYVSVGSRVRPDTIVCMIEAMKVFNEIPAGCSGVIAEVLVQNKEFVEYNTVLFRVDPAG
jgi:acetyl-CoA carboxylase biotin carboxyl carrier protein